MKSSLTIALILSMLDIYPQASPPYLVVSLTKTQCFGQCPAFNFKLYSDCTAVYEGEAFIDKIGNWDSKATKAQYAEIIKLFQVSNFFELEDRYYAEISDLPTTYIFFNNGKKEKKVMDYYNAPAELKELEEKVEDFIDQLTWKENKINK